MPRGDKLPTVWERPPHTKAKHDILTRYLGAWFGIFGSSSQYQRVNVLDGFAGPGRYDDDEPGSPVLALNTLLGHQSFAKFGNTQFNFIFNEWDAERFASLQGVLADVKTERAPWPATVRMIERNQNFQDLASDLLTSIPAGQKLAPTFAFIDQFGYRDVPMALIRDLVSHPSCELFIYFDFNSVNRFANAGNVDTHFTAGDFQRMEDQMVAEGTVREWRVEEGWGVIDSASTPGGCWAFFTSVKSDKRHLVTGERVSFEWEPADQDGYRFRAVGVWPSRSEPVDRKPRRSGTDADGRTAVRDIRPE
ncbi:three-Cys-motif partner protein TcmP [Nocardia sp. NPDC059180]|uniref:three-Cys-motif partner protein TcmP n=1 Tax=Nocardia sp. NPDC059180 TaxID=3346761 RepID=UPI003696DCC3